MTHLHIAGNRLGSWGTDKGIVSIYRSPEGISICIIDYNTNGAPVTTATCIPADLWELVMARHSEGKLGVSNDIAPKKRKRKRKPSTSAKLE
jgi:hypothetical protein